MSKSISEKMDNVVKESMLKQFLGSKNMEDLKKKIVNVIVNQIKDDFDGSTHYLIAPDDVADAVYRDAVEEIKKEVKPIIKEKILQKALKEYGLEDELC